MNKNLVNPKFLKVGYAREKLPNRNKKYFPLVGRVTRKQTFQTATQAFDRAKEIHARWCRLYKAAVLIEENLAQ